MKAKAFIFKNVPGLCRGDRMFLSTSKIKIIGLRTCAS